MNAVRKTPAYSAARARAIARRLEAWFPANARTLPWRARERDPYAALVSEFMLQQTQASRVVERFPAFMKRFPDVRALARATDAQMLRAWAGMGYYRRAINLRDAARAIVNDHGGRTPRDAPTLRTLPGVGRYTAGAVASIACAERTPIADANVVRVALRIEGKELRAKDAAAHHFAWSWADALVRAADAPGVFNEAVMELGAMVCTVRAPRCAACPVRSLCVAAKRGVQGRIPAAPPARVKPVVHHAVVVVRDDAGRLLIEQRPAGGGLWAGQWQAPTLEDDARAPGARRVAAWIGVRSVRLADRFVVQISHRTVRFSVWECPQRGLNGLVASGGRVWRTPRQAKRLAVATPHVRTLFGPGTTRN